MKFLSMMIASLLVSTAMAADVSPGTAAFAAISTVGANLKSGNFRAACRDFGKYLALKSMANKDNTDMWTLRNLGYGQESEAIVANFCSSPKSMVTNEQAAIAAGTISFNVGLESVGGGR